MIYSARPCKRLAKEENGRDASNGHALLVPGLARRRTSSPGDGFLRQRRVTSVTSSGWPRSSDRSVPRQTAGKRAVNRKPRTKRRDSSERRAIYFSTRLGQEPAERHRLRKPLRASKSRIPSSQAISPLIYSPQPTRRRPLIATAHCFDFRSEPVGCFT